MSDKPLTKEMRRCVEWMANNGKEIHRHPGGFWAGASRGAYDPAFGISTVEALVSRKYAEYTEWKDGRSGRFPITAKLSPPLVPREPSP